MIANCTRFRSRSDIRKRPAPLSSLKRLRAYPAPFVVPHESSPHLKRKQLRVNRGLVEAPQVARRAMAWPLIYPPGVRTPARRIVQSERPGECPSDTHKRQGKLRTRRISASAFSSSPTTRGRATDAASQSHTEPPPRDNVSMARPSAPCKERRKHAGSSHQRRRPKKTNGVQQVATGQSDVREERSQGLSRINHYIVVSDIEGTHDRT